MKKIVAILLINISCFSFSQNLYKQISDKNVNQERVKIGKSFVQEYINKCKENDYSKFENYIIAKKFEKNLNDSLKGFCTGKFSKYGNVEILKYNSSYIHKKYQTYDPVELHIFDIKTEHNPLIKYVSVWIFEDKNVIGGLWFSEEKPLYRKKNKK